MQQNRKYGEMMSYSMLYRSVKPSCYKVTERLSEEKFSKFDDKVTLSKLLFINYGH